MENNQSQKPTRFLAFDIEAANGYKLYSICSIGIVVADSNFKVLHRENIWINPKTKYNLNGTRKNVGIDLHLDKELLDNSPDFSEVYPRVVELLTDKEVLVLGHAVDSDVRMLNKACQHYKLPSIDFKFICSQLLYKMYKGEKEVKALNKIAAELDLTYAEHNSEDDAWMSLKTLEYIVKTTGLTVAELLEKYKIRIGENNNFELSRPVSLKGQVSHREIVAKEINKLKEYCKTVEVVGDKYAGKTFAVARSLELMDKTVARNLLNEIVKNGGKYTDKLKKCNAYVLPINPTEQDEMREVHVKKLNSSGLVALYNYNSIVN